MRTIYFLALLSLALRELYAAGPVRVINGRAGNGKSYISNIAGCKSLICPDEQASQSCTQTAVYCPEQRIIDAVGLDDNKNKTIQYQGRNIQLSGQTWPIYDLFDLLEKQKINQVEFYIVYDINNIRQGFSSIFFYDFIINKTQCPLTRIMNKVRLQYKKHTELLEEGDVIVEENGRQVNLKGKQCNIALDKHWRESIFGNDLLAIRSLQNITQCELFKKLEKEYDNILKEKPQEYPPEVEKIQIPSQTDCTYEVLVSSSCRFEFWIFCIEPQKNYEKRINQECVKKQNEERERIERTNQQMIQYRENEIKRIDEKNNDFRKRLDDSRLNIIEMEKFLIDCQKYIANFDPWNVIRQRFLEVIKK